VTYVNFVAFFFYKIENADFSQLGIQNPQFFAKIP
jgi:hypothetical protein